MKTNVIYNEECLQGMEERIPDNSIDMILADLPYGTTACKWDSIIPLEPLWEQYKRVIKDDTAIVLTASGKFTPQLKMSNFDWFRYEWIWKKNTVSGHMMAKKRPLRNHEQILVFYKEQPTYNPIKEKRDMKESSLNRMKYEFNSTKGQNEIYNGLERINWTPEEKDKCYPKTVKGFDAIVNNDPRRKHPTQKPVSLFKYLIKTYTNKGDIVLDNVIGSGTTAVACKALDRKYIGFEQDEKYYEIAQERVSEVQKELIK